MAASPSFHQPRSGGGFEGVSRKWDLHAGLSVGKPRKETCTYTLSEFVLSNGLSVTPGRFDRKSAVQTGVRLRLVTFAIYRSHSAVD